MAPWQPVFAFCPSLRTSTSKCNLGALHICKRYHYSIGSSSLSAAYLQTNSVSKVKMCASPASLPVFSREDGNPVIIDGCELRETEGRGEGVFARRSFRPGEIVIKGVIVAELTGNHSHKTQIALDRFVQHGGFNSFVNHSCDPNCGIKLNAEGANNIVAMRQIEVGDEISFDYAMRNYSILHFPKECMCGAADCRKTVTGYKDLPKSFKNKYEGFIAPYLVQMEHLCQKISKSLHPAP